MIQVRKELTLIRDQELEASNKEAESKVTYLISTAKEIRSTTTKRPLINV